MSEEGLEHLAEAMGAGGELPDLHGRFLVVGFFILRIQVAVPLGASCKQEPEQAELSPCLPDTLSCLQRTLSRLPAGTRWDPRPPGLHLTARSQIPGEVWHEKVRGFGKAEQPGNRTASVP